MKSIGKILALAALLLATPLVQAGTLERIKETETLRVGYRADAAPYSYRNPIGEASGYSVDLCRAVAVGLKRQLDLDEVRIEYVEVSAENRFDAIGNDKIDILCGATTATLSRREMVDFSQPTFIDGASVLFTEDGPASFGEMAGKKVGVRVGTTTEKALRGTLTKQNIEAEVVAVKDHNDGLERLEKGELSAYFADRAILVYLVAGRQMIGKLRVSSDYFSHEPYALAMARGDNDFRLAVDRVLSRLYRSGAIAKIFRNSFGDGEPSDVVRALYLIHATPE